MSGIHSATGLKSCRTVRLEKRIMKNLVIFSAEELYELIHDNPVVDKNSDTIYMSTDCYENGGYKNLADEA